MKHINKRENENEKCFDLFFGFEEKQKNDFKQNNIPTREKHQKQNIKTNGNI